MILPGYVIETHINHYFQCLTIKRSSSHHYCTTSSKALIFPSALKRRHKPWSIFNDAENKKTKNEWCGEEHEQTNYHSKRKRMPDLALLEVLSGMIIYCNFCYNKVKEHDLLSRQLGSHLASEVCQSLLTNSKLPDQNTKHYPDHTCCFPLPKIRASSRLPVLSEPLSGGSQFLMTISLDEIYAMIK